MNAETLIETRIDFLRKCGKRKPGGLYLRAEKVVFRACGRLPTDLDVCPTCGEGFPYSRRPRWIEPTKILPECERPDCAISCSLAALPEKGLLLWIGASHYPTPESWVEEARSQGVSRRIQSVPRGFSIGETWVFAAHIAARRSDGSEGPAIFAAFRPTAIEYVVRGDETDEELEALRKRGITPVRVELAEEDER